MTTPLACMLCTIGQSTDLLLPMAQATVIVAPIFLRDQIRRGARAVTGRHADPPMTPDALLDDPLADEDDDPEAD